MSTNNISFQFLGIQLIKGVINQYNLRVILFCWYTRYHKFVILWNYELMISGISLRNLLHLIELYFVKYLPTQLKNVFVKYLVVVFDIQFYRNNSLEDISKRTKIGWIRPQSIPIQRVRRDCRRAGENSSICESRVDILPYILSARRCDLQCFGNLGPNHVKREPTLIDNLEDYRHITLISFVCSHG